MDVDCSLSVFFLLTCWGVCGLCYGTAKIYDSYKAWEDNGSDQIDIDKMKLLDRMEFSECPGCSHQPGTNLCTPCVKNRHAITSLKRALKEEADGSN